MTRLLIFLIFMVVGSALVYLVFVHELPRMEDEAGLPAPTSDVTMQKIHIKQNRGEGLEWEAFAESATYNESNKQSWLTNVRFQVYRTNDNPPEPTDIKGVANTAFVDDARKRVLLQGKVHIVKEEETEIHADLVDYYTDDGIVKARGNVVIRDKKSFVQGESVVYNVNSERAVVTTPKLFQ